MNANSTSLNFKPRAGVTIPSFYPKKANFFMNGIGLLSFWMASTDEEKNNVIKRFFI